MNRFRKIIHAIAGPPCEPWPKPNDEPSAMGITFLHDEVARLSELHKEASAHFYRVSVESRNYKAERDYANDLHLRYYKADGTWEMLDSVEEVVDRRIQAARDISILQAELAWHEDEQARQSKALGEANENLTGARRTLGDLRLSSKEVFEDNDNLKAHVERLAQGGKLEVERADHFQRMAQDRANESKAFEIEVKRLDAALAESRKVNERLAEAKKRDAEAYSNLIGHRNADILNLTQRRNDLADRHMDALKVIQGLVRLADEYTAKNYITPALDKAVDAGKVILAGYPGNTLEPLDDIQRRNELGDMHIISSYPN